MEYAILKLGGKQYKVSPGEILEIDKIEGAKDATLELGDVLLFVSEGDVKIGKPTLSGAKVKVKVLEQKRGDKLMVEKYKSKVRYRRRMGFRAHITKIQVEKIEVGSVKKSEKTAKPVVKNPKK